MDWGKERGGGKKGEGGKGRNERERRRKGKEKEERRAGEEEEGEKERRRKEEKKKGGEKRIKGKGKKVILFGYLNPTHTFSLVPRPHPLMRRNGLVNQVEFLGLAGALATV